MRIFRHEMFHYKGLVLNVSKRGHIENSAKHLRWSALKK